MKITMKEQREREKERERERERERKREKEQQTNSKKEFRKRSFIYDVRKIPEKCPPPKIDDVSVTIKLQCNSF